MTDRLLASILVFAALSCGAAAQSWAQRSLALSPPARNGAPAAYDLERGRTVLFGGFNGSGLADTWEFDGVAWQQRASATAPSARWGHGMVYDIYRRRVVLFGGFRASGSYTNETWEWDGANWSLRTLSASPSARGYHGMVFDRMRKRAIVFGGAQSANSLLADTWAYDGEAWTQIQAVGAPSPRRGVAMAYDEARDRVVLFGGGDGSTVLGDTWTLGGNPLVWQQAATPTAPVARWEADACYDAASRAVVLVGGASSNYATKFGDVWHFTNVGWTQVGGAPQARNFSSLAYDRGRAKCVLFGGGGSAGFLADTWERTASSVTYWTGAVSTDAALAGNWSNGVPGLASTAVIGSTVRPCAGALDCMDVVVQPGGLLSAGLTLSGNLDATGAVTLLDLSMDDPIEGFTWAYCRCRGGAQLSGFGLSGRRTQSSRIVLEDVVTTGTQGGWGWSFNGISDPGVTLLLRGNIVVAGGINNGTIGAVSIVSDADASLTTPVIDTSATIQPPNNWNVGLIRLTHTSSFTPTGGVVRVRSGTALTVDFHLGGQMPSMVVEQGATTTLRMAGTSSSFDAYVASLDVLGTCIIEPPWRDIVVLGPTVVAGQLMASQGSNVGHIRFAGPVQVAAGALFESASHNRAEGSVTVDGTLRVRDLFASHTGFTGGPFQMPGSPGPTPTLLEIRPAGALVLDANSTLAGFDLRVSGRIEGSNFWVLEPSDAGVQLLAGSTIGAAPFDLRGGRISSSRTGSGTRLLDMQRTASTVLPDLTLEGGSFLQPFRNVRATTPFAVVMSNATGPMAGAAFEDDPLGVITWGQGTRYLSGGTAGCLPMATLDGVGSPRIGASGFAYDCRGAHPLIGGILLIGAPAPAPITVLGLQTSLDLLQPVISNYYGSDAQGRILAPQSIPADPLLVGLSAAAQFALLEPPSCTPSGLSTSNTVQVTIQP